MRKAGLHIEFLGLPMTFVIPVAVMEDGRLEALALRRRDETETAT